MNPKKNNLPPFHLAFPVDDLNKARIFYSEVLGCPIGRESNQWIDFNLFGHQIVAHLSPAKIPAKPILLKGKKFLFVTLVLYWIQPNGHYLGIN